MIFLFAALTFLVSVLLNIPLARKPLSEDDGIWFYPAVFWRKGVRLYSNLSKGYYGYFGVPWMTTKIYNAFRFNKLEYFKYLKIIWYALTAVSIYWLTFVFWQDYTLSVLAGLIFSVCIGMPNTLSVLTYAELFLIIPMNMCIIFTYYGVISQNILFFVVGGLTSAWAFHIKPAALLFSIAIALSFCFTPQLSQALIFYVLSFIVFNLLPIFMIRRYGTNAIRNYFGRTFGSLIILFEIILNKLRITLFNSYFRNIYEYFGSDPNYIRNLHKRSLNDQLLGIKKNIFPAIKGLYLILLLASVQVFLLFIHFDPLCFIIVLVFLLNLVTIILHKNYYTSHFNPCWAPISILAAKTIWDMGPYLLNSGALGWAMIAFIGVESIKIGRIIAKSFSKSERDRFGFQSPLLGKLFRLCESVGEYIQKNSSENDKLFVWGDQPSIYLYAKREAFDTDYLIIYAHHGCILKEKELLDSLREKPPELLLFYNYKVNDDWNIQRLQETIGILYNHMWNFRIADDQRKSPQNPEGILYNFPLYRRDDKKYKEILLDRALIAKINGDNEEAQKVFTNMLEIFPEDYEALIWLSLLGNNGDGSGRSRRYLETELSENNDSIKRPILLRLLADMDVAAGDSNSAMEKYEKALKINSSDFRTYNGLGELYFSQGYKQAALQSFQKVIELNPYSSDALNNIGVLLAQADKRDDAIKCFQKALSFMPSHPDALKNMESFGYSQGSL